MTALIFFAGFLLFLCLYYCFVIVTETLIKNELIRATVNLIGLVFVLCITVDIIGWFL